jgi:hypothetical protein
MNIANIDGINTLPISTVEEITGGFNNINTDHANIHKGRLYFSNFEIASLASGAKSYFLLEAPLTKFMHIKGSTISGLGSSLKLRVFRNIGVISTKGTVLTDVSKNVNDNSTKTADAIFYSGPTPNGGLTDKWFEAIAYGSTLAGNNTIGSNNTLGNPNIEYVSTNGRKQYLLEVENIGGDPATLIEINFFHYEEPKGLI